MVGPENAAAPDYRNRQGFVWRLTYEGVSTSWYYDEVLTESDIVSSKIISTHDVIWLLQRYYPSLTTITANNIIVEAGVLNLGRIDSVITKTNPRGTDLLKIGGGGGACIFMDDNNVLRAFTEAPDNSSITTSGIKRVLTEPASVSVKTQAWLMKYWRTVNWSATAVGMTTTIPASGFNYMWAYDDHIHHWWTTSDMWSSNTHHEHSYNSTSIIDYCGNFDYSMFDTWIGGGYEVWSNMTAYFWSPRTIAVPVSMYFGGSSNQVYINGGLQFESGGGQYFNFNLTFSPGWNTLKISMYNPQNSTKSLRFSSSLAYALDHALSSYDARGYMHSAPQPLKTWTKTYAGVGEVAWYPDGTKNDFSLSVTCNEDPPEVMKDSIYWMQPTISPSDGITTTGATLSGRTLSVTYTATSQDPSYQLMGEASPKEVSLIKGTNTEEIPCTVGFLDDMIDELGLPPTFKDTNNRDYKYSVFAISSTDPKANIRFLASSKYVFSNGTVLNSYGAKQNVVLKRSDVPVGEEVAVVAWSNADRRSCISNPFVIQMDDSRGFYLSTPTPNDSKEDNWYIKIHNARISKRVPVPAKNTDAYNAIIKYYPTLSSDTYQGLEMVVEYSLPEFDRQPYFAKPIVQIQGEEVIVVDRYTVKLKHTPVCHYRPIEIQGYAVKSISASSGMIRLEDPIVNSADPIMANYSYLEEWVNYRGFFDGKTPQDLGVASTTFWHLDLNPAPHHDSIVCDGSIPGHLSRTGTYISKAKERKATNQLLSKPIYIYLYPRSIMIGEERIKNIIGEQSASTTIFHSTITDFMSDPLALLLGKIYIQPNSSLQEMVIIDTRSRGGGLSEEVTQVLIDQINPEANYYWDIGYWDGQPYQENGVLFFRLPSTLLKEHGGQFTDVQVKEIVKKHLALGVLPEIEFIPEDEFAADYIKLPKVENLIAIAEDTGGVTVCFIGNKVIPKYVISRNGVEVGILEANTDGDTELLFHDEADVLGDRYDVVPKSTNGNIGASKSTLAVKEGWDIEKGLDETTGIDEEAGANQYARGTNVLKYWMGDPEYFTE
jgi:hypothetical protein